MEKGFLQTRGLISAGGILLRDRSWPYFCGGAKQNLEHTHLQFKSYHYDVTFEFSIFFVCVSAAPGFLGRKC